MQLRAPALLVLAGLLGGLAEPTHAEPLPTAFVVDQRTLANRLRVSAKPGDLALRNRAVTAVVRRSDGWLVDFWRNVPTRPTAPQLGNTTAIDGLWQLHPTVDDGRSLTNITAANVRLVGDSIQAISEVALGSGTLAVMTSYELDADRPRLKITTRYRHATGGRLGRLQLGDAVKWGNVDYFVAGQGRAPASFSGTGRWVGRRGAGGDLVLMTEMPTSMRIDFNSVNHGAAAEIYVRHAIRALDAGEEIVVRRVLAYEPIVMRPRSAPPTGLLEVSVSDEAGQPLPAKLAFRGIDDTATPDFGNDGDERGAGRFAYSGTGRFSRPLPAGRYEVMATSGIERNAAVWNTTISENQVTQLAGKLERVIATPGWISADLHLHQAPSVDADIACSTRVVAVAAEGVELAVASDHYAATDLAPTVRRLRSSGRLATPLMTLTGTEASTVGNRFGHFNLFPMLPSDSLAYTDTTPRELFAEMRRISPNGLIQVNHPRWPKLGYFHRYRLDPASGRIPAAFAEEYDPSFDVIEVMNGYDVVSEPKIRRVLLDWMHLLGRGHRYTATGNSDSHKLFFVDPGVPRNLIRHGTATNDADDLKADPARVVAAIRSGQVVVTSGPIIDAEVNGVGPGGTLTGAEGRVPLRVRVRAAPWVDVSEVEVLIGGGGNRVRWFSVPPSRDVLRFDETISLKVPGKTFVVIVAKGRKPLPNVYMAGVRPFAFTNPIWFEP